MGSVRNHLEKNALNYIGLGGLTFLAFMIASYLLVKNKKKDINADWEKQRCQPHVMPFVSLFRPSGRGAIHDTMDNFNKCLYKISKNYLNTFMSPFQSVLETIHEVITTLRTSINNLRKFFSTIRAMLLSTILEILKRIEDMMEVVHKTFVKNMEILKKQKGIAQIISYMMVSIAFTMFSMFNSVGRVIKIFIKVLMALGWLVLFFCCSPVLSVLSLWASGIGLHWVCFDEHTLITMTDGSTKPISEIQLHEQTHGGGHVTGLFQFSSEGLDMYKYHNIIVSGCHSVYDHDKWRRIQDCSDAIPLSKTQWNKDKVWCISTETNILVIHNIFFADYYESSDPDLIFQMRNAQLRLINHVTHTPPKPMYSDNYGFGPNTPLLDNQGQWHLIQNLHIGDVLRDSGRVLGIIQLDLEPSTDLYVDEQGHLIAGTTLIQSNKSWTCASECLTPSRLPRPKVLHHLLTENGMVAVGHHIYTDFHELAETYDTDIFDKLLLEKLQQSTTTILKNIP